MTIDILNAVALMSDLVRNLYGASDGHVHPASAICLGRVVFAWYANRALQEDVTGRHPWDILADEFGMTREEYEQYVYDHDYSYQWEDMHELQEWKDAHDPMVQLNKLMGEKYGW